MHQITIDWYTILVYQSEIDMKINLSDESDQFKARLDLVARLCDCKWGDRGSINELVKSIARFERFPVPSQPEKGIEHLSACNRLIEQKQPFRLLYRDSQGALKEWSVRFAEIKFHEKRLYLDAWCEEQQDSDLPELAHNACFRFDRMLEVSPIEMEWRGKPDYVVVELALYGGLVRAYERKTEDASVELDGDRLLVERVVSSSLWFLRSILPYGADCEILSPPILREQVKTHLQRALGRYGNG